MAGVHERNARTAAGIHVGRVGTYDVDMKRLNRVATRIVSALFQQERGARAPDGYRVAGYFVDSLRDADAECKRLLGGTVASAQQAVPVTIGNGVFTYWFRVVQEAPHGSVAAFVFYERIGCVGLVVEDPNRPIETDAERRRGPSA